MEKKVVHYGKGLRELVKDSGTQKEIAERMGRSQSTLAECFNAASPHIDTIADVCRACRVKTAHFVAYMEKRACKPPAVGE